MQEDTRIDPAHPDKPLMLDKVVPWENTRLAGEDLKAGARVLEPGDRLGVTQLGLLAAVGLSQVQVRRQPLLGLIATGSELREAGSSLGPGQIYESNRLTLSLLASAAGAQTKAYPLTPDNLDTTRSALATALAECDAIVTSGGVSVGELDFVKAAFQQLGGELAFWRVAIKPGKPLAFGQWKGKLLFGLPGNPVSAFVTFLLLVRPALLRFQGAGVPELPSRPGILAEALVNAGDRRHFVRVNLDGQGKVRPAGKQASHILHSLARANGLVDVPPSTTLKAGSSVAVLGWD
jgi:molybdopterin molybdotransferase